LVIGFSRKLIGVESCGVRVESLGKLL
jgi:hypothetical protein